MVDIKIPQVASCEFNGNSYIFFVEDGMIKYAFGPNDAITARAGNANLQYRTDTLQYQDEDDNGNKTKVVQAEVDPVTTNIAVEAYPDTSGNQQLRLYFVTTKHRLRELCYSSAPPNGVFDTFQLGNLGKKKMSGGITVLYGSALGCNASYGNKNFMKVIFSREGDDGSLSLAYSEFDSGIWATYMIK